MQIIHLLTILVWCVVERAGSSLIIDLTHPLSSSTIYWPGVPSFNRTRLVAGVNKNNVWIEIGVFTSGEHGGTHIDAPRHFNPKGYDLKDLPLELTIADGIMIDARAEAANNSDYALTVHKIEEWEIQHGRIPDQAAVIVNTGWTLRWPNQRLFFNSNNTDDPETFHFPTVSKEAAQWLVTHRRLKMLGVDVPAPDGPRDTMFPVHSLLLPRNIVILENLMIPDSLPPRDFRLHASPIRIEGGSGTQARIYAMLYDDINSLSSSRFYICFQTYMLIIFLPCVYSLLL
ncbi:unnamed protein product [Candidula unifasciata]|uniref:Cyclase n=1 Tax=Candidula unifasciata TaxID=100452 RepID=A0A8S3YKE2_9EUPU|nr:unnamed protein product [Candidula unifasciata]